jgi:amino acid transporter
MDREIDIQVVRLGTGGKKLRTIDCVGQSLAVGPIFSVGALGPALAALSGGVGPFVLAVAIVGFIGVAYLISELARRFSGTGIVYEYVANVLGKKAALFSAGCYYLAMNSLLIALPIIGAFFLNNFFSTYFSFTVPWWILGAIICALIIIFNILGVSVTVKTQLVIIAVSTIPFLILAVAILLNGGPNGLSLSVFNPANVAEGGSVFKGLLFAILMFVGFELAGALGEETENPSRSIPIAMLVTIVLCGAFYILTQYVGTIGSGGPDQILFDYNALSKYYVGNWLGGLIDLAILLDIMAVGIGFMAACARGYFAIARDGLLPRSLTKLSRRGVPIATTYMVGVLLFACVAVTLIVFGTGSPVDASGVPTGPPDYFNTFLVLSAVGGFLISGVYAILCIGGIKYFITRKKPLVVIAGLVGLATAGGGVVAQFIEGTAPTGIALWGRHIALGIVAVVAVWLIANVLIRPKQVDLAGQHAVQHSTQ